MEQNSKISESTFEKIYPSIMLILSSSLLIAWFITNIFYHDFFMEQSVQFSIQLQNLHRFFFYWFYPFTTVLYFGAVVVPFILLFIDKAKDRAILFFLLNFLTTVTSETIKMIYGDTRPCFQAESLIKLMGCSCSFGMNSGHSSGSFVFYFSVFVFYIKSSKMHIGAKIALFILLLFIVFNVGFSRLYYGAHSFNQVIMGFLLGFFFISLTLVIEKRIILLLRNILQNKIEASVKKIWFGVGVLIYFMACLITVIVLWFVRTKSYDSPKNADLMKTSCGVKCYESGSYLSDSHLASVSGLTAVGFLTFFIGIFRLKATSYNKNYCRNQCSGFLLVLKRWTAFIIVLIPVIIGIAIRAFVNVWIGFAVNFIAGIVFCLLFVLVFDKLLICFNAKIEGDFFIEDEYMTFDNDQNIQPALN